MNWRADKLGRAKFTCTFIKAQERRYPKVAINRKARAAAAIDRSRQAGIAAFSGSFSIKGQPGWVQDSAADSVKQALKSVTENMSKLNGPESEVLGYLDEADSIRNNLGSLLQTPDNLGARMMSLVKKGGHSIKGFDNVFNSLSKGFNFGVKTDVNAGSTHVAGTVTPARQQQQANTAAVENLVRSAHLASASEAVINNPKPPLNRQTINQQEHLLATTYEDVLATTPRVDAHQAIMESYTATVAVLQEQKPKAATLDTMTPVQTLPARVLSYQLYGSGRLW